MALKRQNNSLQEWVQVKGDADDLLRRAESVSIMVAGDSIAGHVERLTTGGKFTLFPLFLGSSCPEATKTNLCRGTFIWVQALSHMLRFLEVLSDHTFQLFPCSDVGLGFPFCCWWTAEFLISNTCFCLCELCGQIAFGDAEWQTAPPRKKEAVDLSSYHFQY